MNATVETDLLDVIRGDLVAFKLTESIVLGPAAGKLLPFTLRQLGPRADDYLRALSDPPAELLKVAQRVGHRLSPLTMAVACSRDRGQDFRVAPVHSAISDAIVDAVTGKAERFVAASMPPRIGKSTLIAKFAALWYLANWPTKTCAVLSYGDQFAQTWGRLTRNAVLDSPKLFSFSVAGDSSAAANWSTDVGGGLWTAGVGGQVTGKGANFLVIDDPVKSLAEATSRVMMDELWTWYQASARTRLTSGGSLVIDGTRWSGMDLIARIIASEGADQWRSLIFPMVAETDDLLGRQFGDLLVPDLFNDDEIVAIKRGLSSEVWSTLYQCQPVEESNAGRAYSFDETRNLKDCVFDPSLSINCSWDFNVDPMSICLLQTQSRFTARTLLTNEKLLTCEVLDLISLPDSNTAQACAELDSRLSRYAAIAAQHGNGKLRVRMFGDVSGNQRRTSSADGSSDWAIIRKYFRECRNVQVEYIVPNSNPAVRSRVNAVNSMLESGRLAIDPRCKGLVRDLKEVRWKKDSSGNTTSLLDKRNPELTHSSDALGYAIFQAIGGVEPAGERPGIVF